MERTPRDDGGAVRLPRLPCVGRRVRVALGALCDCVLRRRHAHLCDRTDDAAARPRGAPGGRLGRDVPPERQLRALRLARLHAAAVGRRHRRVRPADARARGAGARGGGVARRPERRVRGRGPHRVALAPGVGARRAHAAPPLGPRHPRRVLQLGTPHLLRRRQRGLHLGHAQRRQRRCRPPPRRRAAAPRAPSLTIPPTFAGGGPAPELAFEAPIPIATTAFYPQQPVLFACGEDVGGASVAWKPGRTVGAGAQ